MTIHALPASRTQLDLDREVQNDADFLVQLTSLSEVFGKAYYFNDHPGEKQPVSFMVAHKYYPNTEVVMNKTKELFLFLMRRARELWVQNPINNYQSNSTILDSNEVDWEDISWGNWRSFKAMHPWFVETQFSQEMDNWYSNVHAVTERMKKLVLYYLAKSQQTFTSQERAIFEKSFWGGYEEIVMKIGYALLILELCESNPSINPEIFLEGLSTDSSWDNWNLYWLDQYIPAWYELWPIQEKLMKKYVADGGATDSP